MNKKDNLYYDARLEAALNKLISEEWYAYQLYTFSIMAAEKAQIGYLSELFADTAKDELMDHMKELLEWCRTYNYEIPCGEAEFKKFAGRSVSRQVAGLRKKKDAGYYIDEAIKQEETAIASYREVLKYPETCQFTDLQGLLWRIYYDEVEHLEKLRTAKIAYDAEVDLVLA